jgi:predicted O-methyltransferase YrrM
MFLKINNKSINQILENYLSQENYFIQIHERLSILEKKSIQSNRLGNIKGKILYSIVKSRMPTNIVETGVATGYSSSLILMALKENNHGLLTSIDYPSHQSSLKKIVQDLNYKGLVRTFFTFRGLKNMVGYIVRSNYYHIPNGEKSGWVIPIELRGRWDIHIGLSERILLEVINRIGPIDLFFHDSDHSKRNMLSEFETVWPQLKDNGIIISDDINLNDAFEEFCNKNVYKRAAIYNGSLGAIIK